MATPRAPTLTPVSLPVVTAPIRDSSLVKEREPLVKSVALDMLKFVRDTIGIKHEPER